MSETIHNCEQGNRMLHMHEADPDEFQSSVHTKVDTACYEAGHAIVYCRLDEHGFLWAGNGEYESMVNFCPFCGYKAKRPAVDQDEWEKIMEAAAKAKGAQA